MDKTHTKESKNIKSNQKMFVVAIIYQLAIRQKKKAYDVWVVVSIVFLFEKEKCRRRDGHQSPENEPGLLYNLRVCVSVCVYFIVITCFW
jgi:hypothetical protein